MKPLLLFLFFQFSLFSQTLYLLPDDSDNAIHYLMQKFSHAKKSILIITHEFDHYRLKKALIKTAKRGLDITLISAKGTLQKQLALYKNINVRDLTAINSPVREGEISFTIIIIDDRLTCKLSTSLKTKHIKHDIGLFTCKDDKNYVQSIRSKLSPLLLRSTPYLEN
ncbi:MAG: hypothetical protein U9N52_08855 [Campylobacterota bacterium]|nr:hypothetical protein [Campylobacterota bacterium]